MVGQVSAAQIKTNVERWEQRRKTVPKEAVAELSRIPSVGPAMAADLYLLGIREVADLRGRNPEKLYEDFCDRVGHRVDRCVLYTYRCAVYYASESKHDPNLLKWWNWKDAG